MIKLKKDERKIIMKYGLSLSETGAAEANVYISRVDGKDVLIADERAGFIGEPFIVSGEKKIKAELNHENACIMRKLFPFTAPARTAPWVWGIGLA